MRENRVNDPATEVRFARITLPTFSSRDLAEITLRDSFACLLSSIIEIAFATRT